MEKYSKEDILKAIKVINSTIRNCENMQAKFSEGTSQHTLLKNRIKALYISNSLLSDEIITDKYSKIELLDALAPISSIISKCEKALLNSTEGTATHTRLKNIISSMYISKSFIQAEVENRI